MKMKEQKYLSYINNAWRESSEGGFERLFSSDKVGVFTTIYVYKSTPLFLDKHIERLLESADVMGIRHSFDKQTISGRVMEAAERNPEELVIRPFIIEENGDYSLPVISSPIEFFPKQGYTKGIKAVTYKGLRTRPAAKSINRDINLEAQAHAKSSRALEALFVDDEGYVSEGTRSNLFYVKDNIIYTTKKNVLEGVTRQIILEIRDVVEQDVKLEELINADEVFISGSTKKIVPVVEIDGKQIGNGKPGPVTNDVMKGFEEAVERYVESVGG